MIDMINNLINLNFLKNEYIEFVKNYLLYAVIITFILCIFSLIYLILRKNSFLSIIIGSTLIFIGITFTVILLILIISILVYPGLYLSGFIKDLLITKYFYNLELLTFYKEIFINILSILIGSGIYGFTMGKLIDKALD